MPAQFNVSAVELVEFGVGLDEDRDQRYVSVPIDPNIQAALREMVITTRDEMKDAGDAITFDPGEKYAGHENLRLPLDSELASHILKIHAKNLPSEPTALSPSAGSRWIELSIPRSVEGLSEFATCLRHSGINSARVTSAFESRTGISV